MKTVRVVMGLALLAAAACSIGPRHNPSPNGVPGAPPPCPKCASVPILGK